VQIGLEKYDDAMASIEAATKHRCARLTELVADPIYRPLRNDSRFAAVARSVGLPVQ
jgi:hypothetical protein